MHPAWLALAAAACLLVMTGAARSASADEDHEAARGALERGEVMPLAKVLDELRPRIDGEIVATEFERDDGRWLYEIKYIDREGRMIELQVDARTAKVLKAEDD